MRNKNRTLFRNSVYKRDNYTCRGCRLNSTPDSATELLDAHHITPRTEMPNGGYVPENGISLCKFKIGDMSCHEKAEYYFVTGEALPNFHPDDLYILIGSTREKAEIASLKL